MRYLITYYTEYRKNAVAEIRKVDEQAVTEELMLTSTVITTKLDAKQFIERLKKSRPIFIRHIMPIQREVTLTYQKEKDLQLILNKAKEICNLNKKDRFSVQARMTEGTGMYNAKDIEVYLGEYYEEQGCEAIFSNEVLMNYDIHVISVVVKDKICYLGYSLAEDNLNFQCNEYRVLASEPIQICRAENKLKEAICKFQVRLEGEGNALDVGAAPGGWTKVLADYGYQVSAVDPGKLDERLNTYSNITHYRDRVENIRFDKPFSLVTCDMNVDPLETAKFMCRIHNNLAAHGYSIITLKLPTRNEEEKIQNSLKVLKDDYNILAVKNLTHNRREVTVFMQNKR
ncbi:LSU rRNA 2'-O-methyl-C2498 methyltransferase RlmM [Lachnospiraceae bacterium KM106-2]|nr:LSU rRNA 2'-O-methyl-C2498 methyltransferase RlmM [Lachnospiraceae bacterium KM106-2]